MKTRTIKPLRSAAIGPALEADKPVYPTLRIKHEDLPESKTMAVGSSNDVTLSLKKIAHNEGPYDNHSTFEIRKVKHNSQAKRQSATG